MYPFRKHFCFDYYKPSLLFDWIVDMCYLREIFSSQQCVEQHDCHACGTALSKITQTYPLLIKLTINASSIVEFYFYCDEMNR